MKIYHYKPTNREYARSTDARRDPKDPSRFLIPKNCTETPPPSNIPTGKVAVFDPSTHTWSLEEDHRGKLIYHKQMPWDEHVETVKNIGPIPVDYTDKRPNDEFLDTWNGNAWVRDQAKVDFKRRRELERSLESIDMDCVKALRRVALGTQTQTDLDFLQEKESEAAPLADELKNLLP
ncbi:MAG: hypothetical protein GTN99_06990 [Candidatus Dadabacteria bacterium]|nr:hypothetical protein [Candidatus Dadabacteria bacterium]